MVWFCEYREENGQKNGGHLIAENAHLPSGLIE